MTSAELVPHNAMDPLPVQVAGPASYRPGAGWIVTRNRQARAVLSDPSFAVPAVMAGGPVGSISWLRFSVSRFTNGACHARRRARIVAELAGLSPDLLRVDAERLAHAVIDGAVGGGRIDVMACLARRVPMTVLAAGMGIAEADRAAQAACVTAAAYFPGATESRERAADRSTAELVRLFGLADVETVVAKIAVLVQACEATAALIGKAVTRVLPPFAGDGLDWATDAIVAEVARYDPPLRVTRRVSTENAMLDGQRLSAGGAVLLRVDAANRDPEAFQAPCEFDPGRSEGTSLTFGFGVRPCPGEAHAVMLAAGVVQAVRDRCGIVVEPVDYEPLVEVRIPARVVVSLR